MGNNNDKRSNNEVKSIKLEKNESICPNCSKVITIPKELSDDELVQCPYCDTAIFNPLLITNCIVLCNNCNEPNHLSKHIVDELVVYCGVCGTENLNPHSPLYNGMKCPICNSLFHIPNEIMNSKYIQCPFCQETVKNILKDSNNQFEDYYHKADHTNKSSLNEIEHSIFSNQYWLEYKKKYPNFKIVLFIASLIFLGGMYSLLNNSNKNQIKNEINSEAKWYEGGTLHKATVNQWKNATDKNKLATCADFVASIDKDISSKEELLARAFELQCCIDQAVKGAGNLNPTVAEIGSFCLISLGYKSK